MLKRINEKFRTDNRIFGLDLMRFIAIMLVVMAHRRWMIEALPRPVKMIFSGSDILGVELFFVLSGFLIGGILLKQYEKNNFSLDFNEIKYKWSHHFREVCLIRLDSIYYGFIAAYIASKYYTFWKRNSLLFFVLGVFGIVLLMAAQQTLIETFKGTLTNTLFFTFLSTSIAFIIPYLSEIKQFIYQFIAKPITAVSIISYSLYLINGGLISENIKRFTEEGKDWNLNTSILVYTRYWLACLILSTIIFVFFEKPMTDLRNKFK